MIRLVMDCGLVAWVAILLGAAAVLIDVAESSLDGGSHVRTALSAGERLARWAWRKQTPRHAGKAVAP